MALNILDLYDIPQRQTRKQRAVPIQQKRDPVSFVEVQAITTPPPATPRGKKGNVTDGKAFLENAVARAPEGPVPGWYNPLDEYETLWRQGRADSLRDMSGYDEVNGHTGIVAKLGAWQPRLRHFDLIVCNSSAGKDSAAMMVLIRDLAVAQGVLHRVHVVHADLGEAEHPEVLALAAEQARDLGLPFHAVRRTIRGVRKDLFERFIENLQDKLLVIPRTREDVRRIQQLGFALRGDTNDDEAFVLYANKKNRAELKAKMEALGFAEKAGAKGNPTPGFFQLRVAGGFPGFGTRYCTSEFKTAEVSKWTTAFVRDNPDILNRGLKRPVRVLNVLGLRAQESPKRAGEGFSTKGAGTRVRETFEWLPIQTITDGGPASTATRGQTRPTVWNLIAAGGLRYHVAYDVGFDRLSCRLCPLAGDEDVALAALVYPEWTQRVEDAEQEYGFKFKETRSLREVIERGIRENPDLPRIAAIARRQLIET